MHLPTETTTMAIVTILIVLFTMWWRWKSGKKYLPGPMGLPFVGYLPFLTNRPYAKLAQLARKYGPVYSLRLGSKDVVVICDYEQIKEAFSKDDFMGRPNDSIFELHEESIRTGAFNELPWKEQRKFFLHMLREVGGGKTKMEELIKEEILEIVDTLSKLAGKPVFMTDILVPSMANNISSFLYGERMKYGDPKRQRLDQLLGEIAKLSGLLSWQIFFPWIRTLMSVLNIGPQKDMLKPLTELRDYSRKEMNKHEASLDPDNIRDFMDGYLLEIQKRKDVEPHTTFTKNVLVDLSTGLYGAGSGTVRMAVDWLLLTCAAYPKVQREIQREIDEVLGPDRFATGQDRARMPYTEAAIAELLRWKTIIPLNIMRRTLKDTELNGFFIPKDTEVLAVLWAVDHDERAWGDDVMEYKPERFLSADKSRLVKPEHYLPFSVGKRSCPGKPLAEVEVFLYLVSILQKFEVSSLPGKEVDMEGVLGMSLNPIRQEVLLNKRSCCT